MDDWTDLSARHCPLGLRQATDGHCGPADGWGEAGDVKLGLKDFGHSTLTPRNNSQSGIHPDLLCKALKSSNDERRTIHRPALSLL